MDRSELCAQPYSMVLTQSEARWAWCLTEDDGRLIAAAGIVKDGPRRGWLMGFPGQALQRGHQITPLLKVFRILQKSGAFLELRAWIIASDPRAIQFAERFGLAYDCGPATAYSSGGRDMNLHLWRSEHERPTESTKAGGGTG